MAIVKSELIKQLKKTFPNFLLRDLDKMVSILLNEIKSSLKRGERFEIRDFGSMSTRIQKESIRRNPRTGEKVNVPQKKTIHFKMAKDLFKKLNNENG